MFFFLLFLSNSLTKDKTNKTRKESKSSEKGEILVDQVSNWNSISRNDLNESREELKRKYSKYPL